MNILILFFLSFSAFAAPDCSVFVGRACVHVPEGKPTYLHIYHRGHFKNRADFPAAERTIVAREALLSKNYHLIQTADRLNAVVVATGSSAVSFNLKDLQKLEEKYQLKFEQITLSAHSGGYYGLNLTLGEFKSITAKVKQILMLDSFYATKEESLLKNLRDFQSAKVPCLGFMTDHNSDRVKKYYQQNGIFCTVEGPEGFEHDASVGPFLERHL